MNAQIDYEHICRVARFRKRTLPPSIDWRDLANETALRQLMGRQSIDGPMTDLLRREDHRRTVRQVPLLEIAIPPAGGSVLMPKIERAIQALPLRERTILGLRFWLGFNRKEIALRFGIQPNYVGILQCGALQKIRESIQ